MSRKFLVTCLLLCGMGLSACGSDDDSNNTGGNTKPPVENNCTVHCAP